MLCLRWFVDSGSDYCLPWIATQTEFDLISLDWSTSARDARAVVKGSKVGLQGNLDPAVLYCSEEQIRLATRTMLDAFGPGGKLVANLGHGMLPDHPLEGLRVYVDEVHKYSPSVINQKKE